MRVSRVRVTTRRPAKARRRARGKAKAWRTSTRSRSKITEEKQNGGEAKARRRSKSAEEQQRRRRKGGEATARRSKSAEEKGGEVKARSLSKYRALCSVSRAQTGLTHHLTPHLNPYQDLRRVPSRRGCLYPVAGDYPLVLCLFSLHFSAAV